MALGTIDRTPPPFFRQGPSALTKLALFSALAVFLMAADTRWQLTQPVRAALATALLPLQQALQEYPEQAIPYAAIHRLVGARTPGQTVQMWARLGHAPSQRLGAHVDELDLVRLAHEAIRDGLALAHAGDPLDDVVQRLEVLHVHRRDDIDAGGEQRLHVLPPLLVAHSRRVAVGQFVDQCHGRAPLEHRVEVHLLEQLLDHAAHRELRGVSC